MTSKPCPFNHRLVKYSILSIFLLLVIFSDFTLAHPADTSLNGRIEATELAAYSASSPSENLLQQASNIFQLGQSGSYSGITFKARSVFTPVNSAYRFLTLETYAATPLNVVEVAPLPAIPTSYTAYFSLPSNLTRYYRLQLEGDHTSLSFRVPLIPKFLTSGGTVNLFVGPEGDAPGGLNEWTAGQFYIEPFSADTSAGALASYQGQVNAMVDRLEVITGNNYSDFFVGGGKSLSSVSDPFERLEIGMVCLLQDPSLEGSIPHTLALLGTEPELMAAVQASLDVLTEQRTGDIGQVIDQFKTQFRPPIPPSRTRSADSPINTPEQLFDLMLDAEVASQMLKDPMFSQEAGAANTALGFAGLPGKVISGSVGLTTAILQLQYSRRAFQNPSSAKINAGFTKTTFYQDECDEPGSWTATLSAESKEWRVDKALLDLVLSSVSALEAAGDVATVAKALGSSGNISAGRQALNNVESFDAGDIGSASGQFSAAETAKSIQDSAPAANFIQLPKQKWNGINAGDEVLELKANPATLKIVGNTYEPTTLGPVSAVVRVRDGFYSVGVESSDLISLTLEQAQVILMGCPGGSSYEPGQAYTLQAFLDRVANAATGRFRWEANAGTLSEPSNFNGTSTVTWTAPDPAPSDVITITAIATEPLCIPPGAPGPEASCVVQRLQTYVLNVSPKKDCYEPGDVVALEMENVLDPSDDFQANFQLVSGIGSLLTTSPTTATFTVDTATNATIAATVADSPSIFESVILPFGCGEFEVTISASNDPVHPWLFSLNIGDEDGILVQIPGFVTDDGERITFEFTALTHRNSFIFQEAINAYPDKLDTYKTALDKFNAGGGDHPGIPPTPPEFGDVGIIYFDTTEEYENHADMNPYNDSEFIYNDSGFNFTIAFDYTKEPGEFNIPGVFETNTLLVNGEASVTTDGVTGNYSLDPIVPVLENKIAGQISYTISFTPVP